MPRRAPRQSNRKSKLEGLAEAQLRAAGIGGWVREARLLAPRRFLFDFAWPSEKVVLEIHGGQWTGGRHQTGWGFARDRVKMNLLALRGWLVIEACTDHVNSGEFIDWVKLALSSRARREPSSGFGKP